MLRAGIDDMQGADWNFLHTHWERKKEVVIGEGGSDLRVSISDSTILMSCKLF